MTAEQIERLIIAVERLADAHSTIAAHFASPKKPALDWVSIGLETLKIVLTFII
jgi:hypothetical protein